MKRDQTVRLISTVALVTLLAKLLGIVRESLQARAFGTQVAADLYTTANNNTIYLFTTVAYALCVAAVPILAPRLQRSREEGLRAAGNLITITVGVSVLVAAGWIAATFTPWVDALWAGTAAETEQLASYIRLMALALPVIVLTYLLVGLFQSMDHFHLQGSMSIPYNVFLILFLALFAQRLGVNGYVAAVAGAWLFQLATTAPYAVRERCRLPLVFDLRADYVKTFFKTAAVTVLTTSIFLFCYLQDSGMAAALTDSPVSAFYYADKLFTPLTTTLIYSITTVLFPKFTQEYATGSRQSYLRYIWGTLRSTLLLILPISAVLAVFGTPIVRVLFEGGNFTAESSASTGAIFSIYALSMAGFCALDILSRAYYTMERTLAPLLVNAAVLVCNWGLNQLLGSRLGGPGLALGTTISITLGGLVLAVLLLRRIGGVRVLPLVKSLAATLVTGGALWWVTDLVLTGDESKLMLVVKCGGLGVAAAGVYALLMLLTRQEDFLALLRRLRGEKNDNSADG